MSKAATARVVDPVCGMEVDPAAAAHQTEHKGRSYYFCSAHCMEAFRSNPQAMLEQGPIRGAGQACREGAVSAAAVGKAAGKYVCPMHPEIVQDEPGACPKCGMALEPMTAPAEATNPELRDMTSRLWVGAALTVPLLFLTMAGYLPGVAALVESILPKTLSR